MSETVKIIVTLSKGQYENLKDIQFGSIGSRMIFNAVKNGTPLDDIKTEIKRMEYHMIDCDVLVSQEEVLEILDNIGKGE